MSNTLWKLSATELAAAIHSGQATAREATISVLARVADVNPRINAIVDVMADEALAAADAADKAQHNGAVLGALSQRASGLSVGVTLPEQSQGRPRLTPQHHCGPA